MGFFKSFFEKKEIDQRLIGDWFSDLNNAATSSQYGDIKMSFEPNGKLTYEIKDEEKSQYVLMTFFTKGNKIFTNQPSHPRPEETEFYFTGDVLVMKFGDVESRYLKTR